MEKIKLAIETAQTALGIEFGSTRIKAVLIGKNHEPLASGSYDWENTYDNGVWTYPLEQVWEGIQGAFAALKKNVAEKYGVKAMSGMAMLVLQAVAAHEIWNGSSFDENDIKTLISDMEALV